MRGGGWIIRCWRHDDLGRCAIVAAHARWIAGNFPVAALALREIGLRNARDEEIFAAARAANVIVLTKGGDFLRLLELRGSPPKILWLTCGNTSELALQTILAKHLAMALSLLEGGEDVVEIGSR